MVDQRKHLINLLNQTQLEQLDIEEILYDSKLVEVEIGTLIRPSYSSREQIDNLVSVLINSLKDHDFLGGIFVESRTRHVIDGWHRLKLWQLLGHLTIPCYLISCTPIQERKLHLSLNQHSAAFDPGEFGCEFDDINLGDFGFSQEDLQLRHPRLESKFKVQPDFQKEGYTKLITLIPETTYSDLQAIKKETDSKSLATTITHLVKHYYENV